MKFDILCEIIFLDENGLPTDKNKNTISFYRRYDSPIIASIYFCYICFKIKKYLNMKNVYIDLPRLRAIKGAFDGTMPTKINNTIATKDAWYKREIGG